MECMNCGTTENIAARVESGSLGVLGYHCSACHLATETITVKVDATRESYEAFLALLGLLSINPWEIRAIKFTADRGNPPMLVEAEVRKTGDVR